jgi:Outer membrane protein beta-barrel domain
MKKLFICMAIVCPYALVAQIGIKAGVNFANVSNVSDFNSSGQTGFVGGLYLAPPSTSILSSRTEILFSRQGYNYASNTNTGTVNLNYIILPQLMGINITKLVQLQIGAQMAYLLNASVDSSGSPAATDPYSQIMDYYNRFDFGAAAGIEVHPYKGLLIGARYNISFGDMYSNISTMPPGDIPPFIPPVNVKNNVIQIYTGWTFGGAAKTKTKK